MPDSPFSLTGHVVQGVGHGASFTSLDWVRDGFVQAAGIDPYPGTLNLRLDPDDAAPRWAAHRADHGIPMAAGDGESCDARLFPLTLNGAVYGAAVYPEVANYPTDQLEIVSAVNLRDALDLGDGDRIGVELHAPLPVQAVMFDIDGTLLNSLDGYLFAVERAIEPHGYRVSLDLIRQSLNSTAEFWQLLLPPEEHDNEALIRELRGATMRHWPAARDKHVRVVPGATELLHALHRGPARLGVCTGSYGESFPPLERAGLLELFEVVVTGEHVEQRKPAPEGIVRCLDELGVEPGAAVYVGDSVVDIQAATAAGVASIGVLTGAGDSVTLTASGAHRLLPSVDGLLDLITF